MFIGISIFIILMIMGGIIAFLGDKIGSKVGKRRLTLFGLRPRYTSVIVTIVSGILISALTIAVMAVLNENVRVALFGMQKLQEEMSELNNKIKLKNQELIESKEKLDTKTKEYENVEKKSKEISYELARVDSQRIHMENELVAVQQAYDEAKHGIELSAKEIEELESTKNQLNKNIEKLNKEKELLLGNITAIREGTVIFRAGQVITEAVIDEKTSTENTIDTLENILGQVNNALKERMRIKDEKLQLVRIPKDSFTHAVSQIADSDNKKLVRVVAAGNLILGEPTVVDFEVYDNKLIFNEGQTIYSSGLEKYKDINSYELKVIRFLKDLNKFAAKKGVLPDPITGNIGQLEGRELLRVIQEVKDCGGNCKLYVIAKTDIYTSGPLIIEVRVERTR